MCMKLCFKGFAPICKMELSSRLGVVTETFPTSVSKPVIIRLPPHRGTWQCPEIFWVMALPGQGDATGTGGVEARDAAKIPTTHGTVSHNRELEAPKAIAPIGKP